MKKKKVLTHKALQKRYQSPGVLYLIFAFLLVFAAVAMLQSGNQDIRNRAQEATPTPLLRCDIPCSYNSQCPSGLFCHDGACRNPNCPNTAGCSCILTPTQGPITIYPTRYPTITPVPTRFPTQTPVPTIMNTQAVIPTYEPAIFPTIQVTPTPGFEAYGEEPPKLSLLEAFIQFVGNIFCSVFMAC